ncbi:UNVERIFIED_CONTAM: hypothetical protein GTU68_048858 [Idotea baltica]|nr:hypothetical protein [Idotea baltica]
MIRSILFPKPIDFQIYSDFLRLIFIFFLFGCVAMIWSLVHWIQQENVTLTTAIFNSIDLLTFVIPPIIPATITAINLWAQKRLQKNKIFCLSSNYINLAGPVDLVCFDKTGTLTEDDLSLEGVLPCENSEFLPAINDLYSLPNLSKFTQTMATCHSVAKTPDGGYLGHPLDIKIFTALGWKLADEGSMESSKALFSVSKEVNETDCEYEIFKTYPFESVEQRMTTIAKDTSTTSYEVFIKGAPEKIASICSQHTGSFDYFFFLIILCQDCHGCFLSWSS